MRIEVVRAEMSDALCVDVWMRQRDRAECAAMGVDPQTASRTSLAASRFATALRFDGEAVAIGGLTVSSESALAQRIGHAWLLTAEGVERAPMALHRLVKAWLIEAPKACDVVWNRVDARYETALRWFRALGFTVVEPAEPVASGVLFHTVFRRF